MAFPGRVGGPSFQQAQPFTDAQFDVFEWHSHFQSCVRYFLDHSQHSGPIQAVAALINIQLPHQKPTCAGFAPKISSSSPGAHHGVSGLAGPSTMAAGKTPLTASHHPQAQASVALTPYIRRLVATGMDFPAVLHSFFGDDWLAGVGPLHEAERRNYLFAAKSDNWLKVKTSYDMGEEQMIPFLRPLQNVSEREIVSAETTWSEWLAMQDWMLGPRAPVDVEAAGGIQGHAGVRVKREE